MVEVELLSNFQLVSAVATALGVCIAAAYYIMNLRYQTRTRQAQFFLQHAQKLTSKEYWRDAADLLNMEWKDYDDFEKKYGSDNNPDNFALRNSMFYLYSELGYLVRDKLIPPEMVFKLSGSFIVWQWQKWKDVILEQRVRYGLPDSNEDFEYLAGVMNKMKSEQSSLFRVPEAFLKYVPDK